MSSSSTRSSTFGGAGSYRTAIPNPSLSGNAILLGVSLTNNVSVSGSDTASNSYSVLKSSAAGNLVVLGASNVAANAQQVTASFSADPGANVQPCCTELVNVASFGTGGTATGSGTSVAVSALSPSISPTGNDRVYLVVRSLAFKQTPCSISGGTLHSVDTNDGLIVAIGGASMTITLGTSDSWVAVGVILHAGAQGTPRSGIWTAHLLHINQPVAAAAGGTGSAFSTSQTYQMCCSGTTVCAMSSGGFGGNIASITDSASNTWTPVGQNDSADESVSAVYTLSPTTGALTLSTTWRSGAADSSVWIYDIAGVSHFDKVSTASGVQNTAGNLTVGTITPAVAASWIGCNVPVDFDTVASVTGFVFDSNTASYVNGGNASGPSTPDENNCAAHLVTNSTSTVTMTLHNSFGLQFGNWDLLAIAFN